MSEDQEFADPLLGAKSGDLKEDEPEDKEYQGTASVTASALNMINNIVGAGLFSMPWVLLESTIVTGCALMAFMAVLNALSFLLIAKCCDLAETFNYKKMGERALGKAFGTFIQGCCLFYTSGSCISYVVLTGDFLVGEGTGVFYLWAPGTIMTSRPFVLGIVAALIFLPLCLLKNLEKLKYTSFISFIATIYAGFLILYVSTIPRDELNAKGVLTDDDFEQKSFQHLITHFVGFPISIFAALPIINVAFTAHYNGPRFYQELENRSLAKFAQVIFSALGFSLVIYAAAAVAGYSTFGQATLGDILKNFDEHYYLAVVARLALAFVVICTFPLANHSLRESFITLYYQGKYSTETVPQSSFLVITIAVIVVITTIGVEVLKVEQVLAYKGAIFGSCIVYIFPALMYMRLKQIMENRVSEHSATGDDSSTCGSYLTCANLPFIGLATWGVLTGLLGVVITVLKQSGHLHV